MRLYFLFQQFLDADDGSSLKYLSKRPVKDAKNTPRIATARVTKVMPTAHAQLITLSSRTISGTILNQANPKILKVLLSFRKKP